MARILVVDDDPLVLELVSETLIRLGHQTVPAGSGLQALARLSAEPFDLVIADIFMPGGTGLELLISMRAKNIDIPFICVSGGDGDLYGPYATTMASLGAAAVLRKPIDSERLTAALANAQIGGHN